MYHSTVQAKLGREIRPWAGGCWEVDGCVDVMLSVEVNGWLGVELSVEVELSWDGCARMRGSFSVFTDWTSWIPPSTSSTPLSLTDKHVRLEIHKSLTTTYCFFWKGLSSLAEYCYFYCTALLFHVLVFILIHCLSILKMSLRS